MVGYYSNADGMQHSFIKDGNNYTPIDYPGATATMAESINDSGKVVGYFRNNNWLWAFDKTSDLGFLKDGERFYSISNTNSDDTGANAGTLIHGINNSDQMVGRYYDASGVAHGFLLENFSPVD